MTISEKAAKELHSNTDYSVYAAERRIRTASDRVYRYESGDSDDPVKAQTAKLADLTATEAEALAELGQVGSNLLAALQEIDALGARPGLTDAELERLGKIEPAIAAQASAMPVAQLDQALRTAIFGGDRLTCQAWSRQAQAALDRATDAGTRIDPDQLRRIEKLMTEASEIGAPEDPRPELRKPLLEVRERARLLQQEIELARKRRGVGEVYGHALRRAPFPDRREVYEGKTGYLNADIYDQVCP